MPRKLSTPLLPEGDRTSEMASPSHAEQQEHLEQQQHPVEHQQSGSSSKLSLRWLFCCGFKASSTKQQERPQKQQQQHTRKVRRRSQRTRRSAGAPAAVAASAAAAAAAAHDLHQHHQHQHQQAPAHVGPLLSRVSALSGERPARARELGGRRDALRAQCTAGRPAGRRLDAAAPLLAHLCLI